jgi:hypothetical protein
MASDDDLSGIVPFVVPPKPVPRIGEPPALARKQRDYKPECPHHHKEINPRLRRIKCVDCGETLDPIECLLDLAGYRAECQYRLEHIQAYRVKELEKEAREMARKHPLTKAGAVIAGCPQQDPNITWKRYEAARAAADKLPLADRLNLLVKASLMSKEEWANIVRLVDADGAPQVAEIPLISSKDSTSCDAS